MEEEEAGNCHHWVGNDHFWTKLTVPLAPGKGTEKAGQVIMRVTAPEQLTS